MSTTYVVRGGITTKEDEVYGPGIRHYDTISGIVQAIQEAGDKRSAKVITREILSDNPWLETIGGKKCTDGTPMTDIRVDAGDKIKLRTDKEIQPEEYYQCPPGHVKVVRKDQPDPEPVANVVVTPPAPDVNAIPQAQAILQSSDTADEARDNDFSKYFLGRKPERSTAEYAGAQDQYRNKLNPNLQTGVKTRLNPTQSLGEALGFVTDNALDTGRASGGRAWTYVHGGRNAGSGEIEFGPNQSVLVNNDGEAYAANKRRNRKEEKGPRLVVDPADGVIRTVNDSWTLNSKAANMNPDSNRMFKEGVTSVSRPDPLFTTGEGKVYTTTYLGYERQYDKLSAEFTAAPTAQTAEKLLQLNVQMGQHPLVWSTETYGFPSKRPAELVSEMQGVVARLPEGADRDRLTATYVTPYAPLMEQPQKLHAAIVAQEGSKGWINPMADWAQERSEDGYIRSRYGKTEEQRGSESKKIAEAQRYGNVASTKMWERSMRAPTGTEFELGTGIAMDATGQREANLSPNRVKLMETLLNDDTARAAWISHMRATPGGFSDVLGLVHNASNKHSSNYQTLGYGSPKEAREHATELAGALLGDGNAKLLLRSDPGLLEGLGIGTLRTVTAGLVTLGKGRNQDKGLFVDNLIEANLSTPEGYKRFDDAAKEILRGSIRAEGHAPGNAASTVITLTLDPDLATNTGRGKTLAAVNTAIGPDGVRTARDQAIANTGLLSQAPAAVMRSRTGSERPVLTVTPEEAQRILAGEQLVIRADDPRAQIANGKLATISVLPDGQRGLTSDVSRVTQAEMNAQFIQRQMKASPAAGTTLLVSAILHAQDAGDTATAAGLRAAAAQMADHQGPAGDKLAALIAKQVKKAEASPDRGAALASANQSFTAFFSGQDADSHGLAGETLGRALSRTPAVAAGFTAPALAAIETLPKELKDQLARIDTLHNPAERKAALARIDSQFSDHLHSQDAHTGLSLLEIAKLAYILRPKDEKPKEEPKEEPNNPGQPGECCKPGEPPPPENPPPAEPVPPKPQPPTPQQPNPTNPGTVPNCPGPNCPPTPGAPPAPGGPPSVPDCGPDCGGGELIPTEGGGELAPPPPPVEASLGGKATPRFPVSNGTDSGHGLSQTASAAGKGKPVKGPGGVSRDG